MSFDVTATEGAARAGVLRTAHGDVPTPAFMPVGTKATVKGIHPDRLRELGTTILLGNTYHLHFRPGDDLIAELGLEPGPRIGRLLAVLVDAVLEDPALNDRETLLALARRRLEHREADEHHEAGAEGRENGGAGTAE